MLITVICDGFYYCLIVRKVCLLCFNSLCYKMVVCSNDRSIQLDILFVIEGTAVNGAYMNDLKTSYIIPSLE